jgi:hypothetical protein
MFKQVKEAWAELLIHYYHNKAVKARANMVKAQMRLITLRPARVLTINQLNRVLFH